MKKLHLLVLSVIMSLSLFAFSSCGESIKQPEVQDLAECDIGFQLVTYPQCRFNYQVNENIIVSIDGFSATLIEKHEIHQGDTLDAEFYPYVIKVTAMGTTDKSNVDQALYFRFKYSESARSSMKSTVDSDGHIYWEATLTTYNNFVISFLSVTLG